MSKSAPLMLFIMVIWFVISFVTNLIGPLMPIIIDDFHLNLTLAGILPFSFFLAYGLISIPAGALVEARGPRTTLLLAFALNLAGSLAIALWTTYAVVIVGLFVIGLGMAMLQVVINPLMRATGGEVHFAFFSVLAQFIFGIASYVSAYIFAALMHSAAAAQQPLIWVDFYWTFVGAFALLIAITMWLTIPRLTLADDERPGAFTVYRQLMAQRPVRLFFLGIVAYVGTEQSLANWMSKFLETYHHFSPAQEGAHAVGLFWGLMAVGCVLGMLLLRLLDSQVVLAGFTCCALACVGLALYGPAQVSLLAFPLCGFFLSVMFSVVFSLALNSVPEHPGAFSGILCTGILGGAVVPLLVGVLGDHIGLRQAMLTVFVTLGFILSISLWALRLLRTQTVGIHEWFSVRRGGAAH